MTTQTLVAPGIARTERGLVIAGTRLTLYAIQAFINYEGGAPTSAMIRERFLMTDEQVAEVLAYIDANRAEFEAEFQEVLREAEELRRYYEERNRDLLARVAALPPKPEQEAARAKLAALRSEWQQS
jgi:hypothetical protein